MAEVAPMQIDGADKMKLKIDGPDLKKRPLKRKRLDLSFFPVNFAEKEEKISEFRNEINSLVKLCKDLVLGNVGLLSENVAGDGKCSIALNVLVACLMEESDLPLSKLVDEIFEKVKGRFGDGDSVGKATVKSTLLMIGQRVCYGVTNADTDVLEDEDETALWFWETRDLKLIPKGARVSVKDRRTCRKKIHERITSILAMTRALGKSEDLQNCRQEMMKASEKLDKVLNEADIRLLVQNMLQKNVAKTAEKKDNKKGTLLIKQMEKNRRDMERERKKQDRELEKQKLQTEKELKRLRDEAEKEEKRREKEEHEIQKQMKRQQEEVEKDQIRKEKGEAELKRRVSLQKQASLMERFLKRNTTTAASPHESSMNNAATSVLSSNLAEIKSESVTISMDSVLEQDCGVNTKDIWKLHLNSWHRVGCSIRSDMKSHWGLRQKPKTGLVKELKLTTTRETCDDDLSMEKLVDTQVDSNIDGRYSPQPPLDSQRRVKRRQLLQFDKSHRPAFYGVWSRKSLVVGSRHPFAKDPDVDYEVDSDEEWEEDEPGENLSDCDKDDESESVEGHLKGDDEDESEDGFFVPDGYLSENEGVHTEEMESDELIEEVRDPLDSVEQVLSEEFCILLRQQKYLNNLTDHALKKNQPLIILNLMHEKTTSLSVEELIGIEKLEHVCLQTLGIRPLPVFSNIDISIDDTVVDEVLEVSSTKSSKVSLPSGPAVLDSDIPQIISIIKSCPDSISKIVESLHSKFPAISKSQLKNKVREISEFSNNHWQVKKEVLIQLGLPISPETNSGKPKTINTFFSKQCLPPPAKIMNLSEVSLKSSEKSAAIKRAEQNLLCE